MSMYDILHGVLNEASTKNPDDKGTDFSFSDEEKDPANEDNKDPDDTGKTEESDESNKDIDFSIEDDDTTDDSSDNESDSDDIFDNDPSNSDNNDSNDPSDNTNPDDTKIDLDNDEPAEVQPKILNLSKLDSALIKRRLFDQYTDLLSLAYSIGDSINDRKILISEEDRETCNDKVNSITEGLDMYIKHKFYINNYEINFRNYIIFSKNINDLVDFISSLTKHKNKDD